MSSDAFIDSSPARHHTIHLLGTKGLPDLPLLTTLCRAYASGAHRTDGASSHDRLEPHGTLDVVLPEPKHSPELRLTFQLLPLSRASHLPTFTTTFSASAIVCVVVRIEKVRILDLGGWFESLRNIREKISTLMVVVGVRESPSGDSGDEDDDEGQVEGDEEIADSRVGGGGGGVLREVNDDADQEDFAELSSLSHGRRNRRRKRWPPEAGGVGGGLSSMNRRRRKRSGSSGGKGVFISKSSSEMGSVRESLKRRSVQRRRLLQQLRGSSAEGGEGDELEDFGEVGAPHILHMQSSEPVSLVGGPGAGAVPSPELLLPRGEAAPSMSIGIDAPAPVALDELGAAAQRSGMPYVEVSLDLPEIVVRKCLELLTHQARQTWGDPLVQDEDDTEDRGKISRLLELVKESSDRFVVTPEENVLRVVQSLREAHELCKQGVLASLPDDPVGRSNVRNVRIRGDSGSFGVGLAHAQRRISRRIAGLIDKLKKGRHVETCLADANDVLEEVEKRKTAFYSIDLDMNPDKLTMDIVDRMKRMYDFVVGSDMIRTVGIFRKNPNADTQHKIEAALKAGQSVDMRSIEVRVFASLLKQYFKHLPGSPLPYMTLEPLFEDTLQARLPGQMSAVAASIPGMPLPAAPARSGPPARRLTEHERLLEVKKLIFRHCPPVDFECLRNTMKFFSIVANDERNQMGSNALAIVLVPNLLQIAVDARIQLRLKIGVNLVQFLIEHADEIFDETEYHESQLLTSENIWEEILEYMDRQLPFSVLEEGEEEGETVIRPGQVRSVEDALTQAACLERGLEDLKARNEEGGPEMIDENLLWSKKAASLLNGMEELDRVMQDPGLAAASTYALSVETLLTDFQQGLRHLDSLEEKLNSMESRLFSRAKFEQSAAFRVFEDLRKKYDFYVRQTGPLRAAGHDAKADELQAEVDRVYGEIERLRDEQVAFYHESFREEITAYFDEKLAD